MSIPLSFRRVRTRSELPETLIKGRLYFIRDEGLIVLNYEGGLEEYGGVAPYWVEDETGGEGDCGCEIASSQDIRNVLDSLYQ